MDAKGSITREILDLAIQDPRVCYINSDGTGRNNMILDLMQKYSDRVLDVCITEMNMVTIASDLALKGAFHLLSPSHLFCVFVLSIKFTTMLSAMTRRFV